MCFFMRFVRLRAVKQGHISCVAEMRHYRTIVVPTEDLLPGRGRIALFNESLYLSPLRFALWFQELPLPHDVRERRVVEVPHQAAGSPTPLPCPNAFMFFHLNDPFGGVGCVRTAHQACAVNGLGAPADFFRIGVARDF